MQREELEQLHRYEHLIADTIGRRGSALVPKSLAEALAETSLHRRGEYRGLILYTWATSSPAPRADAGFATWAHEAVNRIESEPFPVDGLPAHDGRRLTETVWLALALFAAQPEELAGRAVIELLLASQQPHGPFLKPSPSDNLESLWYHELVLLHAAASYGAARPWDLAARDAVFRATDYHLNETQPDHATNDPWALFAFLWNPRTRPLADSLLHTATTMSTGSAVTLMLLADALYCLRRLISTSTNQDKP